MVENRIDAIARRLARARTSRRRLLSMAALGMATFSAGGASAGTCQDYGGCKPDYGGHRTRHPKGVVGGSKMTAAAYRAGALLLAVETDGQYLSYGTAYLALDQQSPTGASVFTIRHLLGETGAPVTATYVSIPAYIDYAYVPLDWYLCDTPPGDADPTCRFYLPTETIEGLKSSTSSYAPYKRLYDAPDLTIGSYLATPRLDQAYWSVYQVEEFSTEQILVSNVFADDEISPIGDFCDLQNGGPAALVAYDPVTNTLEPFLTEDGTPICVGEHERRQGSHHQDYWDVRYECSTYGLINRAR